MRHFQPHEIDGHICPAGDKRPQVSEKPRYDTDKNVPPRITFRDLARFAASTCEQQKRNETRRFIRGRASHPPRDVWKEGDNAGSIIMCQR